MEYLESFADARLVAQCIHCGSTETRDHCPSRILLDEPYPAHLPVVPACAKCNAGFSLDEEYFACLVECARRGGPENAARPKIVRILETKTCAARIVFAVETARVRNVVIKLARGYDASELRDTRRSLRISK